MPQRTEAPDPQSWLYNKPSEGLARQWYNRNLGQHPKLKMLGMAVILAAPYERWGGQINLPFALSQVDIRSARVDITPTDEAVLRAWQDQQKALEASGERNDPKAHLHQFEATDTNLKLMLVHSDWSLMALGPMLRDGKIRDPETSERLRDQILPNHQGTFASPHRNHLVAHLAIMTPDDHLVLTTRARKGIAFEHGTVSASAEQHIDPTLNNPLADTVKGAVSKLDTAELKLTPNIEGSKIGALFIEPNVNNTGIAVLTQVTEGSTQIGDEVIGDQRRNEFASDHPVRTLNLRNPDKIIHFLSNSDNLHGTAALRILVAASSIYGHQEALRIFYRALQQAA